MTRLVLLIFTGTILLAASSIQSPPRKDSIDRENLSVSPIVKREAEPQGGGRRRPFGGNTRRQNTQRLRLRNRIRNRGRGKKSVLRQILTPRPEELKVIFGGKPSLSTPLLNGHFKKNFDQRTGILHIVRDP